MNPIVMALAALATLACWKVAGKMGYDPIDRVIGVLAVGVTILNVCDMITLT